MTPDECRRKAEALHVAARAAAKADNPGVATRKKARWRFATTLRSETLSGAM